MKTILITGGAGFIGSNLAKKLLKRNKIICLDNFNNYYNPQIKRKNIESLQQNINFHLYEQDILDNLDNIFTKHKIDVVAHLAARAGVRPSLQEPRLYMDVNITGTVNLLEMCKKYAVKKFIFASSSSVYGALKEGPFSEEMNILNTISPYGASKVAGEVLCQTYANLYDIQISALRYFTVYGPGQRPDLAISKFMNLIDQGKDIPMYGDGSTKRSYTYIDDIVEGTISAIDYNEKKFNVFNLGGEELISLKSLIENIELVMNKKAKINQMPDQLGDAPLTYADLKKSKKELKYNPKTNLKNGLKKYYDFLSK